MFRNKDKYPYIPSDFSVREIEAAVTKAGTIRDGAKLLGVNEVSLACRIRGTGATVKTKSGGGKLSCHDWEAIERAWRARPIGTVARSFAEARGINSSYFYRKAGELGFYGAPPENGRLVTKPKSSKVLRFDGIDMMTAENKAKACATIDRIKAREVFGKMIRQEKNTHRAALQSARARTKAKFAEGMAG